MWTGAGSHHFTYCLAVRGNLRLAPAHSERLGAQDEHEEHKKCRIRLVKAALANGLRDVDESIIFVLTSFAEGFDLLGGCCPHVTIANLAFAVPNRPLEDAWRERIKRRRTSAFMEITVPETGVRLAQAVGRLLRTDQN